MNYTDYLWIKLIVLFLIVFFVNLIYAAVTGKTIEEARRDRSSAERQD